MPSAIALPPPGFSATHSSAFAALGERLVPGDRLPGVAVPQHRALHTIGIVEALQRRLATLAQATSIHGVGRVAFDLDGAALARLDQNAAARRTLAAGARVPVGNTE